jgi:hypothetical protein
VSVEQRKRAADRSEEEASHPCGGDDQIDGGFRRDVSVSVEYPAWNLDIISSVSVAPLQPVRAGYQDLVRAGDDVEVFEVAVTVKRHRNSRWYDAPHDADLIDVVIGVGKNSTVGPNTSSACAPTPSVRQVKPSSEFMGDPTNKVLSRVSLRYRHPILTIDSL